MNNNYRQGSTQQKNQSQWNTAMKGGQANPQAWAAYIRGMYPKPKENPLAPQGQQVLTPEQQPKNYTDYTRNGWKPTYVQGRGMVMTHPQFKLPPAPFVPPDSPWIPKPNPMAHPRPSQETPRRTQGGTSINFYNKA